MLLTAFASCMLDRISDLHQYPPDHRSPYLVLHSSCLLGTMPPLICKTALQTQTKFAVSASWLHMTHSSSHCQFHANILYAVKIFLWTIAATRRTCACSLHEKPITLAISRELVWTAIYRSIFKKRKIYLLAKEKHEIYLVYLLEEEKNNTYRLESEKWHATMKYNMHKHFCTWYIHTETHAIIIINKSMR